MKKLGALLFLLLLAVAVWAGARYLADRGTVKATIVFDHAAELRRGDPVVENQVVVGRVTKVGKLDDRDAVTVRLDRDHRRAIVTDSMFDIQDHRLMVANTFAVGRPVDDGAILVARDDKGARWRARHGGSGRPLIDKLKAKSDQAVDQQTTRKWEDRVREWFRS